MTSRPKIHYIVTALFVSFLFSGVVSADTLGQSDRFFVNSQFDKYERSELSATLRHVSDRTYFYVDDSYWGSLGSYQQNSLLNNIIALSREFDLNIYSKGVGLWGSESNPGIDGDPKITILLQELIRGNGGYFDSSNGYSIRDDKNSNERDMIILSVEVVAAGLNLAKPFLAHEFQHVISFNQKEIIRDIAEDIWLNELRSEYSITAAGYNEPYSGSNLEKRVGTFLNTPSDSLAEWPNNATDYGVAATFAEYLVEQYGPGILSESLRSQLSGIPSINNYLASKNYYEKFDQVFMNWMGASYLNDISRDSRLGYRNFNLRSLRVAPQQRVYMSQSLSEYSAVQYIKDWQPVWLEYDLGVFSDEPGSSVRIDLSGDLGERFTAAYLAFYDSGSVQFGRIDISGAKGSAYILNSDKRLTKLAVLVTKSTKTSDFSKSEPARALSVKASIIPTGQAEAQIVKDGSLIKRPGEREIYVIWGKYKRYLVPGVLSLYGHLDPSKAVAVEPEVFDSYITSNYIKYVNDEKVYAVWPDGTKHWLSITPQRWDESGRDWNAIFTVNDLEVNFYQLGPDIIR